MTQPLQSFPGDPRIDAFLPRIHALYARMDQAYAETAQAHAFHCTGCEDNCCETWFHHHTYGEYLVIMEGCGRLDVPAREESLQRAHQVMKQVNSFHDQAEAFRSMCPLNREGRCLIYAHRPMICRLHGVRHQFTLPNGAVNRGPGCQAFEDAAKKSGSDAVLDRTPFYREMAAIEQELRQTAGFHKKIKMTVAEMLAGHPWSEQWT